MCNVHFSLIFQNSDLGIASADIRTHVAHENMMSRVRTYLTYKMCNVRTYVTHECAIIFCPN